MFTVLFIDDDPSVTAIAKEVFIYNDMNCILCDSYDCAILAINNGKVDIIILDIVLKGEKSGLDVLQYLRSKKINIPVIVTTGYGDKYNSHVKGFNAVNLEKPYSPESLIKKIKESKQKK